MYFLHALAGLAKPPAPAGDTTAPVIDLASWAVTTQTLDVDVTEESGSVDIGVATWATGSEPSNADVLAGVGTGIVEAFTSSATTGLTGQDLGLTATSENLNGDGTSNIKITVRDEAGNITATNILSAIIDLTPPVISSSDPADNATDHPVADPIVITFDKSIQFGTGNIVLRENNGGWADLETFDVTTDIGAADGQVQISGAVLTINPTGNLTGGREYAVRIPATAIDDTRGNSFAGIANDTTLSFIAAAAATVYIDTDFGASFPTGAAETQMSNDIAANTLGGTPLHQPTKDYSLDDAGYAAATVGAYKVDKTASFPRTNWRVDVAASTNLFIDIDLLIGASSAGDAAGDWIGSGFRLKVGTSLGAGDIVLQDYVLTGQPRIEEVVGLAFNSGANTVLWVSITNETATGGSTGGDPVMTHFKMGEVS